MQSIREAVALGVTGSFVELDGEPYYKISGSDRMAPFFITLASNSDLWMFLTSKGGLTAGRRDADGALFPYETVDRLHDAHTHTGPVTALRIAQPEGRYVVWRPFHDDGALPPELERNLYKNALGSKVVFEEVHHGLGLRFRYRWAAAHDLGWVRTVSLHNTGDAPRQIDVVDGLRNLLPTGVNLGLMQGASCLVDAYKQSEILPSGLAVHSLTSRIVDRAEAAEQLRASVTWCVGLPGMTATLDDRWIENLKRSEPLEPVHRTNGRRGNYLVHAGLELPARTTRTWHMSGDVGCSHAAVANLDRLLASGGLVSDRIQSALDDTDAGLRALVASADGLQATASPVLDAHHQANVLFNCMRGGVFYRNHQVTRADFAAFVASRSRGVAERSATFLDALPSELSVTDLRDRAMKHGDPQLWRLAHEYLPLHFGRRHGDPSRPWNRFSIRIEDGAGNPAMHYEGNWRDIFQNWEALCLSFPEFLPSVIAKFVNASTVDGHNPYRISSNGVDWETEDPEDPWSYIGYWGDHQIIYLLKLLEMESRMHPDTLPFLLDQEAFSYAEVPYRLKPYPDILGDRHHTVTYDHELATAIEERVAGTGADGRLLSDAGGEPVLVSLFEKLLVPALAKLSNLVAGGGIWMNTQRPEWNDANNALVGNGLSMVTLCYLRRYLAFAARLFSGRAEDHARVSVDVERWFRRVGAVLRSHELTQGARTRRSLERREMLDELGRAYSDYRLEAYASGFQTKRQVRIGDAVDCFRQAVALLDATIDANRRDDGLYHSYNLLGQPASDGALDVHRLPAMLEGQVAVISSGTLSVHECGQVLKALFESSLYRDDIRSFLLYPAKELPAFLARNRIPEAGHKIQLLAAMVQRADARLVEVDATGVWHFQGDLANARDVERVLNEIASEDPYRERVAADREAVLDLFEQVFRHHEFTGRSGAMVAYEGIGCTYWHMVAKLLLAVQEQALAAQDAGDRDGFLALANWYYRVRAGLGFEKTVAEYGAFPTDPYSHTPADGAARQPGMTGQVKEEILTRFGELGVRIVDGCVAFQPTLLRAQEFLNRETTFRPLDVHGKPIELPLSEGSLGFTYCQVPVRYVISESPWVRVVGDEGEPLQQEGNRLSADESRMLLGRQGGIRMIDVGVPRSTLLTLSVSG